jgi:hypothetical protein
MKRRRAVTGGCVRALALCVAVVTAVVARPAHADNVDILVKQLEDDSDKVRLSAVVNLTKLGDSRASVLLALVKRVNSDNEGDKNVRGAAANALGALGGGAKGSVKGLITKALQSAESNDPNDFVRQQASQALTRLGAGGGASSSKPTIGGGKVYANIGPMSSKTGANDAKWRGLMVKVATTTMNRTDASMATAWPSGGTPSKVQLEKGGYSGFYVDGTLNELKIDKSGSNATVSCKISMLLASFPDKSVFGFLNGGAKVQGSASARDIDLASEDCVTAVVEDLIAKKIVPTIKSKLP